MAERRMFTKKITDSDAFIEMSSAAQALYFHLNQGADDDGFNNQIQMAMHKAHASTDDLKILMAKNFVIRFESGVIVIKHWRMHNTLRKDRYTPTNYQEELSQLGIKENGSYSLDCQVVAKRLPSGCQAVAAGKVSIGKDSIGQYRLGEGSVEPATATATEENQLKLLGGELGKNVVYLTDRQFSDLMDRLGLDAFNRYVERLATFIIEKNAHIKCHYDMILKWWEEDTQVSTKPKAKPAKERYGDFDVDEAYRNALNRSYGSEEKEE
jgi:hypothetical protein